MTFLNKTNSFKRHAMCAHEPQQYMSIPLILLGFGSLFVGFFTKDMIVGLGSPF